MNYLLDSNILLYAKMSSMPEHPLVSKWLEQAILDQNNTINICETSVLSFLRIATNQKVFNPILPNADAEVFIDSFLNNSNVNLLYPSANHYLELTKLMDKHNLPASVDRC